MKKGKSFTCSILELFSVILIITAIVLITDEFYVIIIAGFLIGAIWLACETLERKGKFEKIDQKIYNTAIFRFLSLHRTKVYGVLFTIAICLTLWLFM